MATNESNVDTSTCDVYYNMVCHQDLPEQDDMIPCELEWKEERLEFFRNRQMKKHSKPECMRKWKNYKR